MTIIIAIAVRGTKILNILIARYHRYINLLKEIINCNNDINKCSLIKILSIKILLFDHY